MRCWSSYLLPLSPLSQSPDAMEICCLTRSTARLEGSHPLGHCLDANQGGVGGDLGQVV